MLIITALIAGLVFGMGLIVSGMAQPDKVQAFLDVSGAWDPSLAFVMLGAVLTALLPFSWAKKRSKTVVGETVQLPANRRIDRRLIGGSLLFGIGWGVVGYCPGPALVGLGAGNGIAFAFVVAMLGGMFLYDLFERRQL